MQVHMLLGHLCMSICVVMPQVISSKQTVIVILMTLVIQAIFMCPMEG